MRPRIAFARFLLRAGDFLRSLPVVVLRPADMIEWSRQGYERDGRYFATANDVYAGLTRDKLELWGRLPVYTGHELIWGVGGEREAAGFGRHEWHVTGLDFSEQKLREEFLAGGFAMPDIDVIIFDKMMRGGAILRKSELRERRGLNKFSVEGER